MAEIIVRYMVIIWLSLCLTGCANMKPAALGCVEGRLSPCPDSPNCVSSQDQDRPHYVAPLVYEGSVSEARQRLMLVLRGEPRAHILEAGDRYLHVTFTSRFFRFVDDVEFCFDTKARVIHVRSASRTGYYDFGVNRKRIEQIRSILSQTEN